MDILAAPLEGLTDALYRRAHRAVFGGVDAYYLPFVSPSPALTFNPRDRAELSPAANAGVSAVPQVLTNDPGLFLGAADMLRNLGYPEINLNLGCPSGTVTAKGKGAAMLRDPDALDRFLEAVFSRAPLPISIKARLGYDTPEEWPALQRVFLRYPLYRLILHPRTCKESYSGHPHHAVFRELTDAAPFPVILNGDVFTAAEARRLLSLYHGLSGLMLGRGLAADPSLGRQIDGGGRLEKNELIRFHDTLYRLYLRAWPETAAVGRMHGVMQYLRFCLADSERFMRPLLRATRAEAYEDAVQRLFSQCLLLETPAFVPPGS